MGIRSRLGHLYRSYATELIAAPAPGALDGIDDEQWGASCASFAQYEEYRSTCFVPLQRRAVLERDLAPGRHAFAIAGSCAVCRRASRFLADFSGVNSADRNWRETLLCRRCRLASRLRAVIDFLDSTGDLQHATVYTTEWNTPFFRELRRRARSVIGSEFLRDGTSPGHINRRGVPHQDLTHLTLASARVDLICTNDVLEHVPNYHAALAECFRCLKPAGRIVITVPFLLNSPHTVARASVATDGTVVHALPPEYHNDPQDRNGALCFYHFGWDFLDDLKTAGFVLPRVHLYWSYRRGYLGTPQYLIVAEKAPVASI